MVTGPYRPWRSMRPIPADSCSQYIAPSLTTDGHTSDSYYQQSQSAMMDINNNISYPLNVGSGEEYFHPTQFQVIRLFKRPFIIKSLSVLSTLVTITC